MTRLEIMCRTAINWAPLWGAEWALNHIRVALLGDQCPETRVRGVKINRRMWLGAQITDLRKRVPEYEKLARTTPPRTLIKERNRVESAKRFAPILRAQLEEYEKEYAVIGSQAPEPLTGSGSDG